MTHKVGHGRGGSSGSSGSDGSGGSSGSNGSSGSSGSNGSNTDRPDNFFTPDQFNNADQATQMAMMQLQQKINDNFQQHGNREMQFRADEAALLKQFSDPGDMINI